MPGESKPQWAQAAAKRIARELRLVGPGSEAWLESLISAEFAKAHPPATHRAIECTMRTCSEHRDLWHHYESDIAQNKELRDQTYAAALARRAEAPVISGDERQLMGEMWSFVGFLASCVRGGEKLSDEDERMIESLRTKYRDYVSSLPSPPEGTRK